MLASNRDAANSPHGVNVGAAAASLAHVPTWPARVGARRAFPTETTEVRHAMADTGLAPGAAVQLERLRRLVVDRHAQLMHAGPAAQRLCLSADQAEP